MIGQFSPSEDLSITFPYLLHPWQTPVEMFIPQTLLEEQASNPKPKGINDREMFGPSDGITPF